MTTFHVAISVDIDRFSDAKLRREYLPMFAASGVLTTGGIREACAQARAKGLGVFPPCNRARPDGSCAGHEAGESGGGR